ncbi:hypothetical protein GQR58_010193 [Nymphon striatum]|nr:hypothetical protein GQR58_010193 [Nymphon striatum]
MWPKNHRRNPLSGWDVVALAATAGASPAPSGRPHPTPPGYPQWHAVHTYHIPRHDIRNHPQRPLLRARRYRWLDPYLVTHSKRAVVATLNLHKVDVKRYTPKGNPHPGFPTPASPAQNSNESSYSALKKMILSDKKKHIIHTSKKDGRDIKADGKVFILSMLVCKKLRESDPNLIILEEEFMHGGIYFVWQKNLTVAPILKRTSGYLVEKIGQCPTQYGKKDPRCELEG